MPDPNADIIKGYSFSATLQLRTPLRVLQHHDEVQPWSEDGLPPYAHFLWEGIWLPITYSFEELAAIEAKLGPSGSPNDRAFDGMAGDIGPISGDGGMYLAFLKAFRGIVEFAASPDEKREAISALSNGNPEFAKYISMHRSQASNWPDEWLGYQEWLQIRGIRTRIARRIYDAGFRLPEAIRQATDEELAAVKGIGKATIAKIRRVMSQPPST